MKRLAAIPMLLLTVIALLFPVASIALIADGYALTLTCPSVAMAIITVVTLLLSLLAISAKPGWFATLLGFLLPAFTGINCLFFLVNTPSMLVAILAAVCMVSVCIASISCRHGVISCLLLILVSLACLGFIGYAGYTITGNPELVSSGDPEIILDLASPEGGYTATVYRDEELSSDFNTYITLNTTEEPLNFFVGKMQREPVIVCTMLWDNFELSGFKWIDENTLMCNGDTYAVSMDGATLIEAAAETAEEVIVEEAAEANAAEEVIAEEAAAEANAAEEAAEAEAAEAMIAEEDANAEESANAEEAAEEAASEEAAPEATAEPAPEATEAPALAGAAPVVPET